MADEPSGQRRRERAERGAYRAEDAVAREQRRPRVAARAGGEARVLERKKDADVARARIQRADESDHEQRPERRQAGEARYRSAPSAARRRAAARVDRKRWPQAPTAIVAQRRAEHRRGRDDADVERAQADREQVGRQQHRHVAVGEGTQRAADEQRRRADVDALGQSRRAGVIRCASVTAARAASRRDAPDRSWRRLYISPARLQPAAPTATARPTVRSAPDRGSSGAGAPAP